MLQKIQGHPHQMALDFIQLLPDLPNRHVGIVQMPLLDAVLRQEVLVVFECFDYTTALVAGLGNAESYEWRVVRLIYQPLQRASVVVDCACYLS